LVKNQIKNWQCPGCNQEAKKTKHHVCPRKDFRYSPVVFVCWDCHEKLNFVIHEKEKQNGGVLEIKEYFQIWEDFASENIDNLYNESKNKIVLKIKKTKRKK